MSKDGNRSSRPGEPARPEPVEFQLPEASQYQLTGAFTNRGAAERNQDNFEELERRANLFLKKINEEAAKIIARAHEQVERLQADFDQRLASRSEELQRQIDIVRHREEELDQLAVTLEQEQEELKTATFEQARKEGLAAGREQGRAEGLELGKEQARQELQEEVERQTQARVQEFCDTETQPLHKLIRELKGARHALLKNWQENILQIAAAIAYQTIMREPSIAREAPLDLLREALELAMNCTSLKIRMNPRDVNALKQPINNLLEETGCLAKSELIPDPKVSRGGCLVETSLGVVDERLEARLERIVDELSH